MESFDVEIVVTVTAKASTMAEACQTACIKVREATKELTGNNYGVEWIGVRKSKYSQV